MLEPQNTQKLIKRIKRIKSSLGEYRGIWGRKTIETRKDRRKYPFFLFIRKREKKKRRERREEGRERCSVG
jgi:hypothetical protein